MGAPDGLVDGDGKCVVGLAIWCLVVDSGGAVVKTCVGWCLLSGVWKVVIVAHGVWLVVTRDEWRLGWWSGR